MDQFRGPTGLDRSGWSLTRRLERDGCVDRADTESFRSAAHAHHASDCAMSKDDLCRCSSGPRINRRGGQPRAAGAFAPARARRRGRGHHYGPSFRLSLYNRVEEEPSGGSSFATGPHCFVWDGRSIRLREGLTVIGRAEDADLQIPLAVVVAPSRPNLRARTRGDDRGSWQPARLLARGAGGEAAHAARERRRDPARYGVAGLLRRPAERHDARRRVCRTSSNMERDDTLPNRHPPWTV